MEASSRNVTLLLVPAIALIGGFAWWLFQPTYGEISPKGYQYAMAIYSATNQKNAEKVKQIAEMVDQSAESGELSAREADWLDGIIQQALNEDWQAAMAAVRVLMEEQTRQAEPLPSVD